MRKFRPKILQKKYISTKRRKLLRFKNHPFVVPIITLLVLSFLTMVAFIGLGARNFTPTDSHVVIVSHDDKRETLPTRAATVGLLLDRLNIKLNQGDVVEPAKDAQIVEDNFRVNVYRAQPVTIEDKGRRQFVFSAATTPRSIVKQAGIKVHPEDKLEVKIPEDILRTNSIGKEVVIKRSTQVFLVLYGTPVTVRTHAKTVGDFTRTAGISTDEKDTVQPKSGTKIKKDMFIVVSRKGTKFTIATEILKAPIKVIEDSSLSFGATAVRQQGSDGKAITVYQLIESKDGTTSRKKIQRIVAEHPVTEIVARGKAIYIPSDKSVIMSAAGVAKSDYPYANFIISHENALWCPTRWQGQTSCAPYYEPRFSPNALVGYGLCQATPGSKMASAGGDWQTNPVTQMRWCSGYASRYGGWSGAYEFWLGHGWW